MRVRAAVAVVVRVGLGLDLDLGLGGRVGRLPPPRAERSPLAREAGGDREVDGLTPATSSSTEAETLTPTSAS